MLRAEAGGRLALLNWMLSSYRNLDLRLWIVSCKKKLGDLGIGCAFPFMLFEEGDFNAGKLFLC